MLRNVVNSFLQGEELGDCVFYLPRFPRGFVSIPLIRWSSASPFKWSVNMSQQIQLLLRVSYINNKWIPQLADSHQNVWKVLGVWRQNTEVYRATLWIKMFMMQLSTCVAFYGYGSFDVTGVNTYGMSSFRACVTWAIMWFQ